MTSTPSSPGLLLPEFGEINISDINFGPLNMSGANNDAPLPQPAVIIGDGGLLPQPFYGRSTENAESWLSYLHRYAAYKEFDAAHELALF